MTRGVACTSGCFFD